MSSKQFMVRTVHGEALGPVSSVELMQLAQSGRMTAACLVQAVGGSGSWHPAGGIRGLVFAAAVPPAPVPVPVPVQPAFVPAPVPASPVAAVPSVVPGTQPTAGGGGDFAAALRALAMLPIEPAATIQRMAGTFDTKTLVGVAQLVNVVLNLVPLAIFCFNMRAFMRIGDMFELVVKGLAVGYVPYATLSLANFGLRKVAIKESTRCPGFDALAAAAAFVPVQLAVIAVMVLGPSEPIAVLGFLAVLLSILSMFAINVQDAPRQANRLLFLTPVQYAVAGVVAALLYRGMFGARSGLF